MKMSKRICKKILSMITVLAFLAVSFGWMNVFAADSAVMEQLLQDVSPKGSVSFLGGETLELRALAASGSTVTAQINGQTVSLSATSEREEDGVWYTGSYTIPSVQSDKSLGQLKFTAEKDGRSESRTGAEVQAVVLRKYVDVENPGGSSGSQSGSLDNVTPASGDIVRINAEYADIFSSVDRGEDYASPYWYLLQLYPEIRTARRQEQRYGGQNRHQREQRDFRRQRAQRRGIHHPDHQAGLGGSL